MKSAVYNWRLSSTLKNDLEETARQERASVLVLLERMVTEWLAVHRSERNQEDDGQRRLHAAAAQTFGMTHGANPNRSVQMSETVRDRLAKRHAR